MKETKEVLHVICVLVQTIKDLKGQVFELPDIVKFVPLIQALSVAIKDADQIKAELKNIDKEGMILIADEITEVKDSILSLFDK